MNRSRRRLLVPLLLFVLLSFASLPVLTVGVASAAGTTPVGYPNPTTGLPILAATYAHNSTTNAYAEVVGFTYNVTPAEAMPSAYGNTWVLTNLSQSVTRAKGSATVLTDARTWVNYTGPIGTGATGGGFGTGGTVTGTNGAVYTWSLSTLTLTVTDASTTLGECHVTAYWGDGSSTTLAIHGSGTHTYAAADSYAVQLTVSALVGSKCLPVGYASSTISAGLRPIADCALQSTTASFRGCEGTLTCDGAILYTPNTYQQPPRSVSTPRFCSALNLNWSAGANNATGYGDAVSSQPTFTVTRMATLVFAQAASWGAVGSDREVEDSAVAFLGDASFLAKTTDLNNSGTFCHFTPSSGPTVYCSTVSSTSAPGTSVVAQVAWWLPYPAGNWDLSSTVVTELDTNTPVPLSNVTVTETAICLEWSDFPVVSANVTQHYSFSLLSLTPLGTTGPPGSVVVLTLGNVTTGPTYTSASASWENYASGTFNGTYYLEGSWLTDASGITLYANGVLIPSYEWLSSGSSVTVYSGYVGVPSQGTLTFVAHYTPAHVLSLTAPWTYVDGVPLSPWSFMALVGLVGSGYAIYRNVEREPEDRTHPTWETVLGVVLFTLFWVVVLAGG